MEGFVGSQVRQSIQSIHCFESSSENKGKQEVQVSPSEQTQPAGHKSTFPSSSVTVISLPLF
jgi:hypothetical protein